jgi:prephenate dehydratase
LAQELESS